MPWHKGCSYINCPDVIIKNVQRVKIFPRTVSFSLKRFRKTIVPVQAESEGPDTRECTVALEHNNKNIQLSSAPTKLLQHFCIFSLYFCQ